MKSILHLKEDTEYQIPLREGDIKKDDKGIGRAKVVVTPANKAEKRDSEAAKKKTDEISQEEAKQAKSAAAQSQGELHDAQKPKNDKTDQSEADSEAAKETEEDESSQEEVNLKNLEKDPEETQNQEQSNTEENNNNTTTESVPQVDSAKAALDEMKKLASQEGVIHPSLFISNFSKILGLMERAMQLQVKESGSATEEKSPETNKQTETPAKDKQGELNGNNTNNNRA